ncbi:protein-disulfide reductase DsbD family protein [Alkalimonas collagenimarina]|uniref:Protein-disulfide reductase DsbD family protein n=1 Tax=Alkalimonas collagenimarina TaxID=400390 RepID=A0ABT9GXB8_9GAMM|nr:protein-disulfide reductase DsbD domain-containing protein [Alkalimonas collagenimarina]MDP4535691.1 protein-disulfide reductase DsbD family protein [Alkalimonas collagenimarina]
MVFHCIFLVQKRALLCNRIYHLTIQLIFYKSGRSQVVSLDPPPMAWRTLDQCINNYLAIMKLRHYLCAWLLLLLTVPAHAVTTGFKQAPHIQVELVSQYQSVSPGQSFLVALHLLPQEHWHTYWLNPGDSGMPTSIQWQLPDGVEVSGIQWPTPEAFSIPPLMNYGFEGSTVLLSEVQVPADYSGTSLLLKANASWLVCEEICIPGDMTLELPLAVARQAVPSEPFQALIAQGKASQPVSLQRTASYQVQDGVFSAVIESKDDLLVDAFFVAATDLVEHARAQEISWQDGSLLLRQPQNTYFHQAPDQIEMVLISGSQSFVVQAQRMDAGSAATVTAEFGLGAFMLALLLAAGGGLILNLMPCVFPVLSLKAISLANNSGDSARQKRDAWSYTLGVLAMFALLALVLIGLRAAGAAVGWGFQLQNPWLVGGLAYLFFALGLSLSGLVQFGSRLMQLGSGLGQQQGAKGSFFTGVLAVIVASPCTAPFMGAALGYAVTQSAPVALLVFLALGFGMALPFLLLAYSRRMARLLPKPGAWMDTLKQWLAYPLYLTTVWLLWVLGRQAGVDAQALVLVGLVCLAAALWLFGRHQLGLGFRLAPQLSWALALLALLLLVVLQPQQGSQSSSTQAHWEPWSPARLAELTTEQQPVLVNMTADWCITCLVNERVALNTDSSRQALQDYGVTYLKGDWTLRDADISIYLQSYQRDGVPLYVLYWPGKEPLVLPQILTPNTLRDQLAQLAATSSDG